MDSNSEVDMLVKTLLELGKNPSISSASFVEDDYVIAVTSNWTIDDFGKKEKQSFTRAITFLKSDLKWDPKNEVDISHRAISSGPIITEWKLRCDSNTGGHVAYLSENKDKVQFLQVWAKDTILKTYDLKELKKHGKVYTSGAWGSVMKWNSNGTKLIYLAEKKAETLSPFFTSHAQSNISDEEIKKTIKGEEYILKESWGEQLNECFESVIVHLDITTDKFSIFELPDKAFPYDIHWADEKIVGAALINSPWKLGFIYCSNRESRIFTLNTNSGNLEFLSDEGIGAFSPRVRPDGRYVIWQERSIMGPHMKSTKIIGMSIHNNSFVDKVELYNPKKGYLIYQDFPINCWTPSGRSFFTLTYHNAKGIILKFSLNFSSPTMASVDVTNIPGLDDGADCVHWISDNYVLYSTSSVLFPGSLHICSTHGSFEKARLTRPRTSLNAIKREMKVKREGAAPSFYYEPLGAQSEKSVPLIVWPHGGPHSLFPDSYSLEAALFLKLGYGIVRINYIGSIGTEDDETESLLGKIGVEDVNECQEIAELVLETQPNINPNAVFAFGGSHGGFLSAHLTSAFPDFYKATVLRNPVTDLSTMIGMSDITDWVYEESGSKIDKNWKTLIPGPFSVESAKILLNCSPIEKVDQVKAGTLLLLGSEDLRVPMAQGVNYYRALKAFNKAPTEVRVYPDCHPLQKVPVKLDCLIHSALWFKRFMK